MVLRQASQGCPEHRSIDAETCWPLMSMGVKHPFTPCTGPQAQRLPAKIWELLRRNKTFQHEVDTLRVLDEQARKETKQFIEIAGQYSQALADQHTGHLGKCLESYNSVKERPLRKNTFDRIEKHEKMNPLAALALQWLVPEPLFLGHRERDGRFEDGTGLSPDLNHPSWKWWKADAPQGAIGHYHLRGPEIGGNFHEWENWRPGGTLFEFSTPWNRLPNSFKYAFASVWRQNYDLKNAYEFNNVQALGKTDILTRDDFARYLDFLDTVTSHRLFAVSPAILTTKDVGDVFARLQNQIKRTLPEICYRRKRTSFVKCVAFQRQRILILS